MLKSYEEQNTNGTSRKENILMTKDDKVELISRIESSKTYTIKWMFIFWIGQLAAVAGILFALLNVYLK
ncbi:MAG: hypothetical protein ABI325_09460 [Ginsengibacter sp.]